MIGTDLSGRTVRKWECRLRIALLCSFRVWAASHQRRLQTSAGGLSVAMHSIRADATNSNIWQRQKLHVTQLTSGYSVLPIFENSSKDPKAHQG